MLSLVAVEFGRAIKTVAERNTGRTRLHFYISVSPLVSLPCLALSLSSRQPRMKRRNTRGQTPQGDEPGTTPVSTTSTDSPSTTTKATPGAPPSPAAVPQSTASKHANKGPKKAFLQKRRLSFIIGGLMGVFGA